MKKLISFLLLIAAPMAAACPTAEDMTTNGVYVQVQSPRGDVYQQVYRKVKEGVESTNVTRWHGGKTITQTVFRHGLFPIKYRTIKLRKGSVLLPLTYTYQQDLSLIELTPGTQTTLSSVELATNGFRRDLTTAYHIKRIKKSRVAGCNLRTMKVIAHEEWKDTARSIHDYLYFVDLGFAVRIKATTSSGAYQWEITTISEHTAD